MKDLIFLYLALTAGLAYSGSYDPRLTWPNPTVIVCFTDEISQVGKTGHSTDKKNFSKQDFEPEFFNYEEQRKIEHLVTKEFTPKRTGIHYIGWLPCSKNPEADIYIIKAGDYSHGGPLGWLGFEFGPVKLQGISDVGRGYTQEDIANGYKKTKSAIVIKEDFSDYTVSHQFSLSAGMVHEHVRKGFKEDPSCREFHGVYDIRWTYNGKKRHSRHIKYHGEYDPMSITSYCSKNLRREMRNINGELSEQDLKTLRHMYNKHK